MVLIYTLSHLPFITSRGEFSLIRMYPCKTPPHINGQTQYSTHNLAHVRMTKEMYMYVAVRLGEA